MFVHVSEFIGRDWTLNISESALPVFGQKHAILRLKHLPSGQKHPVFEPARVGLPRCFSGYLQQPLETSADFWRNGAAAVIFENDSINKSSKEKRMSQQENRENAENEGAKAGAEGEMITEADDEIDNVPVESIGSYARIEPLLTDDEADETTGRGA